MKILITLACIAILIVLFVRLFRPRHPVQTSTVVASPPDDGRLRIRDLTIEDIRSGQNWKVTDPDEFLQIGQTLNLEDMHIVKADSFSEEDTIAYSAVFVRDNGQVSPVILIKDVGDRDYGGDYCEIHNGKWRQVGLVPNPNAPWGTEYIANPLDQDPSFDTMDNEKDNARADHQANFKKWSVKLEAP